MKVLVKEFIIFYCVNIIVSIWVFNMLKIIHTAETIT
jgi:hypothetical protein